MQLTTSFVAALIGASAVAAIPTPATTHKKVVTIPMSRRATGGVTHADGKVNFGAVERHLTALKTKYGNNLKAYKTNSGKVHSLATQTPAASKRGVGYNPLTAQESGALWTGPISFGGQSFDIDFDTGSADCLVGPGYYDPNQSSSSQDTGTTFSTAYGDGTTAQGEVYEDNLSIAGLSAGGATIGVASQTFLDSSENSAGICGMSLPGLSQFQQRTPFFYSLINAGAVDQNVFAFALSLGSSELTLGGLNSNLYSGSPTYVGLNSNEGFWQISGSLAGHSDSYIIDSGTSLIVAPTSTAQEIFDNLGVSASSQQGTLYGAYDCSNPPEVSFNFGGKTISLTSSAVTIGQDDSGNCLLSVVGQDIGISGVIAGDPLFESSYVAFDVDQNAVGFADRA